jgi:iron complex outermembrane receptor protein
VTPSIFAQDEYSPNARVTFSGSGRVDFHNKYGTFFNPRISALVRLSHGFTTRISTGTGFFAPTPFTEETEATAFPISIRWVMSARNARGAGQLIWAGSRNTLN